MIISPATRIYLPDEVHSNHRIIANFPLEFFEVIKGFQDDIIAIIHSNMHEFVINTNNAFKQESHGLLELKNMEWTKFGITQFGVSFSLSEEAMSYIPYQDIDFIDKLLQEKPVQENSRKLAFSLNSGNIQDIQSAFMLESVVNRYIYEILNAKAMQDFTL